MNTSKKIFDILPEFIQKKYKSIQNENKKKKWIKDGKPYPTPHVVKQEHILEYKIKHNSTTLVETGTFLGDMVWSQQKNFEKIYSIELNKDLFRDAQQRFKRKTHIQILQGDSGKILPILINEIKGKTIFWLDGHYSGGITARGDKDCPIWDELKAIFSTEEEHVLLIDDARLFIGERDYPTIDGVKKFTLDRYPNSNIEIKDDIIIIELEK